MLRRVRFSFLTLAFAGAMFIPIFSRAQSTGNSSFTHENKGWKSNVDNGTDAITGYECGDINSPITHKKGSSKTLSTLDDTSDSLYLYNEALPWYGVNNQFGLDTMRLYCRRHPFAVMSPGELLSAFTWINQFLTAQPDTPLTVPDNGYHSPHKYIIQYNWWIDQYPLNIDFPGGTIAGTVLLQIMSTASSFDRNLACNLAYNFSTIPQLAWDTEWAAECWQFIASVRNDQMLRGEDTTAFNPMSIPPPYYPVPGSAGVSDGSDQSGITLSVVPNPANGELTAYINTTYSSPATLELYNAIGQRVQALPSPRLQMGTNQFNFDCSTLPAGNYFLRLEASGTVKTVNVTIEH